MRRRIGHDQANIVQPVAARRQGTGRFIAQIALLQVRVVGGDIRRVAGNQVESLASQRRKPAPLPAVDIAQPTGCLHCAGPIASAAALASVAITCACGRSLAMASAIAPLPVPTIGDTTAWHGVQALQRELDQHFCIGARDQRGRRDR